MKRLFSAPGLRWRGRIKQFEREVYDGWADHFDRSVWTAWLNRWVESLVEEIPEGSAILDIGCGTGSALRILAARQPTRLAGIDISPKAIAVASEKLAGLGADLRVQDAEAELPWPDETFDAAAMTATIHHFPHLESSTIVVSRPARKDGPRSWRSLPSPRDGKWAAARAWQPDRSESSSHRVSAALIRAGSCATNICSARREE